MTSKTIPSINQAMPHAMEHSLAERCLVLQARGDHQTVLALCDPDIVAGTASARIWHLRGISLYRLERYEEARQDFARAIDLQPDFPDALNGLGFVLQDLGLMEEARSAFEKSVRQAPEIATARLNLGMAQLKLGDWQAGWENYEARWAGAAESGTGSFLHTECPLPQWDGQAGTIDQALLVFAEQGFGDTFQFSRYLDLATQRFARVGFVCMKPVVRLMEWSFGDKVEIFNPMPKDFTAWHWKCPLMSMPRAFQTRIESIPAVTPYLKVPQAAKDFWRARLDETAPDKIRVGIAWAGRKVHQYDARRSLAFELLLPVLHEEQIAWISLQKWGAEEAHPVIPADINWLDWTGELADFADTAALVANLDLIISIDSSMVHLAGALARPVWMLNRFGGEWRWLDQREDSPWYPGLRIFNQPKMGDWASVLEAVQAAIKTLTMARKVTKNRLRSAVVLPSAGRPAARPPELSIHQAMQLAIQHQGAGRLRKAENILRRILQANPAHAHALHLLGIVVHQAGQTSLAIKLIGQAILAQPDVALFQSNLAEMCRQQGLLVEAIQHGRRAVELEPSMASAHSNLGIALYDAKDYANAEASHQKALAIAPDMLQSLNNMGSIQRARNNQPGAESWYRRALAIRPAYLESLRNLGALLVESGRVDEAVPMLETVLGRMPDHPDALCDLGLARLKQGNVELAISLLQRTLKLKPDHPEALSGLTRAMTNRR